MPDRTLWPHQRSAVEAAERELAGGGRAQVVMACGTGKTIVGAEVSARLAPAGRVLVLVPSLELLAQTVRELRGWLGDGAGRLAAVCSDASATIDYARFHSVLDEQHAPVTTDPALLADHARAPGRITVIATYQSLTTVIAAHREGMPAWDLILVDEAHRTAGAAAKPWAAIHSDKRVPAARRLYLTATPRSWATDQDVASMDDPAVFGEEVYRLPFAEAIQTGLLADYRVVVSVITDRDIARLAHRNSIVAAGHRGVPARMLAAQLTLLKAIREHRLRRVITYHHRVLAAKRFAATLPDAAELLSADERPDLPVTAASVDADMPPVQRRRILAGLRHPAGTAVVSNCRVLAEGVDVPALDGVMFADPRDSATDVIQSVGRALRRGSEPGKVATILIPVLVGSAESAPAALEGSEWQIVWRVVRALRAHDERMADYLDEAKLKSAQYDRWSEEMPSWLSVTGMEVTPEFAQAVALKMLELTTSPWLEWLAALEVFRDEHGHAHPRFNYVTPGGLALGKWLSDQRVLRRKGKLPSDRRERLEKVGVVWEPHEAAWAEGLAQAAAYRAEHGDLDVPMRHTTSDGYQLGDWVTRQRIRRRSGRLTADQIERLDRLGMEWEPADRAWRRWIGLLRAFRDEHGHANVPRGHMADGDDLGLWLNAQRNKYRRGQLSADRIAQMERLGVVWYRHDAAWQEGLSRLAAFRDEHGHALVPVDHVTADGYQLGKWVARQRQRFAGRGDRRISAQQIEALNELGMVWRALGGPRGGKPATPKRRQ